MHHVNCLHHHFILTLSPVEQCAGTGHHIWALVSHTVAIHSVPAEHLLSALLCVSSDCPQLARPDPPQGEHHGQSDQQQGDDGAQQDTHEWRELKTAGLVLWKAEV